MSALWYVIELSFAHHTDVWRWRIVGGHVSYSNGSIMLKFRLFIDSAC